MTVSAATDRRRVRVRIDSTGRGVGFRAFLYHLARSLELAGFAYRDARGVVIEIEGDTSAVSHFLQRLDHEAPPRAAIERVDTEELTLAGETAFRIVGSSHLADGAGPGEPVVPTSLVAPDIATCDACLSELVDPRNHRYRYPFINCSDCGPRFTIVRSTPWQRARTTMAGFAMCERCQREFDDPLDRRFHAQPNACPACGPTARLLDRRGRTIDPGAARDAVRAAAHALRAGAILAIKGIGGYHLACRADDAQSVATLRARKNRAEKPFAVMVADVAAARRLAWVDDTEAALLSGRERPIVLARRRAAARLASSVAPGHRDLGLMLPYSPLTHLLLADTGLPLVMTSANAPGEPMLIRDADALARLAIMADLFLVHDREIASRADDSVVRAVTMPDGRQPLMIRRARGYAPASLPLPVPAHPAVVAVGGHTRNTFTLAAGERAWVGHHVGDLETVEAWQSFREGIAHLGRLCAVEPSTIAHDPHPEYLSSRHGAGQPAARRAVVQHHHAHFAATLAEHGEMGQAIGIVFDGHGHGEDGAVWGGEILCGDVSEVARVGHLWPVRMPGGTDAILAPWRMACAWLKELQDGIPAIPHALRGSVSGEDWRDAVELAQAGLRSPMTTSVGRLLDAISALCGVCPEASYEGQAAIELEMVADEHERSAYSMPVARKRGQLVLDARALVRAVVHDLESGVPVPAIAARAHRGLAVAAVRAAAEVAGRRGITTVALSGGVFQNVLLLERTTALLAQEGLRWLVPRRLPPNDGGLSYGQAVVAAARAEG
ncbi:MAG TPA: carbamoyltransferase HypF [Gemmatimonadaceae bacterium]|nr:carbamoyltransferase HypF [Gemmatimonadaceae bacterium]